MDIPTTSPQHHVVTSGLAGPHLLVIAGVHGDEFEPMLAVHQLHSVLATLKIRGRVTLVPIANAPALARGQRTAEDNLDLARTCPGLSDGSITERIAFDLSAMVRTADYFIDLHTGGHPLSLLPLAGYMLHSNSQILEVQRRMARVFNLPLVWGTSPALEGRTLSVARDAGIPAIYVEHGGGSYEASRIIELIDGCLNVMAELKMIDRPAPASAVRFISEDRRAGSGHLQVNYPAPLDGLFRPAAALGDIVKIGQIIGSVIDIASENHVDILAKEPGVLAMIRVWPRINVGEPLAVIVSVSDEVQL